MREVAACASDRRPWTVGGDPGRDKSHPLTHGYACIKGIQAVEQHYARREDDSGKWDELVGGRFIRAPRGALGH